MNKKSTFACMATLFVSLMLLTSCSNHVFRSLCESYAQIIKNNVDLDSVIMYEQAYMPDNVFQRSPKDPKDLEEEAKAWNRTIWEEAKEIAADMEGKSVPFECSEASGIKLKDCYIKRVDAAENSARIFIEATPETPLPDNHIPFFFLVDDNDVPVLVSVGSCSGGKIHFTIRMCTTMMEYEIRKLGETAKLVVVCQDEFKAKRIFKDDEAVANKDASCEDQVIADGIVIKRGASLVSTLRQAKHISWNYSDDLGL